MTHPPTVALPMHRMNDMADLYSLLTACEEYFEPRADAEIDVSGTTGNEEMRLLMDVREALKALPERCPECNSTNLSKQAHISGYKSCGDCRIGFWTEHRVYRPLVLSSNEPLPPPEGYTREQWAVTAAASYASSAHLPED